MAKGKIAKGALEALTDIFKFSDAPVDESKRSLLKGAAVAPVAGVGALAGIKAGTKLLDDVPVQALEDVTLTPKITKLGKELLSTADINTQIWSDPEVRKAAASEWQEEAFHEVGIDKMKEMGWEDYWFKKDDASLEKLYEEMIGPDLYPISQNRAGLDFSQELRNLVNGNISIDDINHPLLSGIVDSFLDSRSGDQLLKINKEGLS